MLNHFPGCNLHHQNHDVFLCLEENNGAKPSRLATGILGRKASQPIDRWYIWGKSFLTNRVFPGMCYRYLVALCLLITRTILSNHSDRGVKMIGESSLQIGHFWLISLAGKIGCFGIMVFSPGFDMLCQVISWFLQVRWIKTLFRKMMSSQSKGTQVGLPLHTRLSQVIEVVWPGNQSTDKNCNNDGWSVVYIVPFPCPNSAQFSKAQSCNINTWYTYKML